MNNWTASALQYLKFPATLIDKIIETQGSTYANDLASNSSTGASATKLFKFKLKSDAVVSMVRNGDYSVVDYLLSTTKEKRDTVLYEIRRYWDITPADQMRLVNRRLTPGASGDILSDSRFLDQAKLVVAPRAEPAEVGRWIVNCSLDDDTVYNFVVDYVTARPDALWKECIGLLMQRPGLRTRFAASGVATLVQACAWVQLDTPTQEVVVNHVLTNVRHYEIRPILGLLASPWTTKDNRDKVWSFALANETDAFRDPVGEALRFAIPSSNSPIWPGTRLQDVTDPVQIETLLTYASGIGHDDLLKYLQAGILIEISQGNLASQGALVRRVLTSLVGLSTYSAPYRRTVNKAAIDLATRATPSKEEAREMLTKAGFGYAHHSSRDEDDDAAKIAHITQLETTQRSQDYHRRYRSPVATPSADLSAVASATPERTYLSNYQSQADVSAYLVQELGDGTSVLSEESWTVFFDMVTTNPAATFGQLTSTARKMASMTTAQPANV